jgi:D-lactate dehydrogenase (cytochrome)
VPDAIAALIVRFDAVDDAVQSVVAMQQCALPLARMELLDRITVHRLNVYLGLDLPETPLLFLEVHAASAAARDEQLRAVFDVLDLHRGTVHATAITATDRERLWEARHKAFYAGASARPGVDVITTDVCVPISALPMCIAETRADLEALGMTPPLVGHVGDGNFHLLLHVDTNDMSERARVDGVLLRLTDRALRLGGTCTGEHGIGVGKRESLRKEHGDALAVMHALKYALDPLGILNPGKILPDDSPPSPVGGFA